MAIFKKNSNGSTTTLVDYSKPVQDAKIDFTVPNKYIEPSPNATLKSIVSQFIAGIRSLSSIQSYDNIYLYKKGVISDALNIDTTKAFNSINAIQKVQFGQTVNLPQAASNYREFAGIREVFVIEPGNCYLLRFTFPPFRSTSMGVDIPGTMFFISYNAGKWSDWEQVSFTSHVN